MKSNSLKVLLLSGVAVFASAAMAEMMDRPSGIKIGERMTLKPYVAVSAAYDSNVDGRKDGSEDVLWIVNPGLGLEYKAENWHVLASAFYQFHAYTKKASQNSNNNHTFGENLTIDWTDSMPGERGWSVVLTENFNQVNETQDMSLDGGRNYNRDRRQFTIAGAIQRRFAYGLHANVNAGYYWLDYLQNNNQRMSGGLYGWDRWSVGTELGYAPSKWTDFLLVGGYQGYNQKNSDNNYYAGMKNYGGSIRSESWTVQAGIGSYATERISYRLLGGWSNYRYIDSGTNVNGFSYTVAGNWQLSETWKTMIMANSAYQPSEREFASAQRVDSVSWGIAHSMVRGKLTGSFDVAYRRETREIEGTNSYNYDLDILTFRLGLNYTLNRYLQLFTNFEYRKSMANGDNSRSDSYDYDRFRGTLGLRLTY